MESTDRIQRSPKCNVLIDDISTKLMVRPDTILSGWPFVRIEIQNVKDILGAYHELRIHRVLPDVEVDRCWYIAGQIVARIVRDRRDEQ